MKTILEQQKLINPVKEGEKLSVEKDESVKKEEDEEELNSESDNEEIVIVEPEAAEKRNDVNLDDEFEKIVPFKFKRLSEESIDEVDNEIVEILSDAEPLEQVLASLDEITENYLKALGERELAVSKANLKDSVVVEVIKEAINEDSLIEPHSSDTIINEAVVQNDDQKPPVPIPTYLWEDVKKSKEQVSGDNVCTFHLFHAFKVTNMRITIVSF